MMEVIIVGEDAVTQAIIKRLIGEICPNGMAILRTDPARGGQLKSLAPKYNQLAANHRIIMLADRSGFAEFIGVGQELIPEATGAGRLQPENTEIRTSVKSSLFVMHQLAAISAKREIREALVPVNRSSKGPQYNSALVPFIENDWDIDAARQNSNSLNRMYSRLQEWCNETLSEH